MKLLACLLLGILLGEPAWAQTRSPGPWRVEDKLVRVEKAGWWGENMYYDLLNSVGRQLPTEIQAVAEQQAPNDKNAQQRLVMNWQLGDVQVGDTVGQAELEARQKQMRSALGGLAATGWQLPPPANPATSSQQTSEGPFWDTPTDTSTIVRMQRIALPIAWDVNPATVTLLRNCENPLLAPSGSEGIRFTATGATLRLDRVARRLLLVSTEAVVVLRAYRGRRLLFAHTFEVTDAPAPIMKCFYSAVREEYMCKPAGRRFFGSLVLKAIPNPDFAAFMPEDARYRVSKAQASLWRQEQKVQNNTINGPAADLGDWYPISQPDDLLQVEVLQVQRMNFQGIIESKPIRRTFRQPYRDE